MGYDAAGENLNLNLALTLGYLNPALNNSALILSTNSYFFSLSFRGLGLWHEAYTLSIKWSHLDFASHWAALATFLFSRII